MLIMHYERKKLTVNHVNTLIKTYEVIEVENP